MTPPDAIVVGAGPAGSTTALLLARAGARVVLLDRAGFPRDKPCSEYLNPAATRILDRLGAGVLDAVRAASPARLIGMKVATPGGREMTGLFGDRTGLALPRRRFDAILLRAAAAAGADVREAVKVEELLYDGGAVSGVAVRTGGGRRELYRARVVVGADGLRSVVARRLGPVDTSPPRRVAFTAHVRDVPGVADVGEMHVGRTGYVGLGPIGGGVTTVALVVPAARVRALELPGRFFERLGEFAGLAGRFDPSRLTREILVTGPFAQWSRRPVAAGALLVGDAADFFDPFTGQGIYGALRGAELAAETLLPALANGGTSRVPLPLAVLRPYAGARRRAFTGKWLIERLIAVGVGWPALAERVVTRLARHTHLADLLVGCTGNVVPARRVLTPGVLFRLLW